MTISTVALVITSVFTGGGGGGGSASPPKDEKTLKKWLRKPADVLKKPAGKVIEAWPAILESVVDAILSLFK